MHNYNIIVFLFACGSSSGEPPQSVNDILWQEIGYSSNSAKAVLL